MPADITLEEVWKLFRETDQKFRPVQLNHRLKGLPVRVASCSRWIWPERATLPNNGGPLATWTPSSPVKLPCSNSSAGCANIN